MLLQIVCLELPNVMTIKRLGYLINISCIDAHGINIYNIFNV